METIIERRYNSTYDFVASNGLQIKAEECFGKGWEAEDDVSQIQELINHVGRKDLIVSFVEGLKEDDILVSKNPKHVSIEDLKDIHENIRQILIDYGNEEVGDCIIDDICMVVGIEPTTVYYNKN